MKYAELKRGIREAMRAERQLRERAEYFEREMCRLIKERESFKERTMREALAMMQRAVEYAPPAPIPICKCMEAEMRERFPAKTPLCTKCKTPMTHKGGIVYTCDDQLCAFGHEPWQG
jgi:hypothetical protein